MDLGGDGIKTASKNFQESAWVFEHLISQVSQLPAGEATVDFSKESLSMAQNLCLAQAQYLFFRKARDAGMKKNTLSKICAQIGIYFTKAHEDCQVNPHLRAFDAGHFANVLGYHGMYYTALSWLNLAEYQVELTNKNSKDCGKCVTQLKIAVAKLEMCKQTVGALGGAYAANFNKVHAEAVALRDQMIKENKTIYYDTELAPEECPKPDPTNYVKTESVAELINSAPAIDNQFRHLIPPAVRQMQDELKNMLQGIISEQFNKVQTCNEQLNNFLKSMNLPMAIQGLSAQAEIPNELWAKIEGFQKKGSAQNFTQSIASN